MLLLCSQALSTLGDIIEFFFYELCEWVGRKCVKVITFGKVELDEKDGLQMIISSLIGIAVLIGLGVVIAMALGWF